MLLAACTEYDGNSGEGQEGGGLSWERGNICVVLGKDTKITLARSWRALAA